MLKNRINIISLIIGILSISLVHAQNVQFGSKATCKSTNEHFQCCSALFNNYWEIAGKSCKFTYNCGLNTPMRASSFGDVPLSNHCNGPVEISP